LLVTVEKLILSVFVASINARY